ncbi:response regulator [Pseudogracilibacillus auburnensis]|uniref:LuxR family two component transcriptional regulator n=1 Tax=Pseudogracilibacillus auburnensis TaxID=1494959 RepID=A0A2V3VHV5_9BACI|nr:response regulator transcription factor [Pseudogracilibacillus auburnensis]MBO1004375.1 response regulator transcription factor [Pseudogracilibacillus auburnensis]PXW80408.1 LuxR family two component transcriptional regulator [Pseudogracilibacillus auburnensis]
MIKVLIAEDFSLLLEDLEETINSQADMKVVGVASDGRSIVELAWHTSFDIILMDIEMEHMTSGIDATREIREYKKDAKIIYLTAHGTKEIILTAMATGAIDYIIKGVPEEDILLHIRSAYSGKPLMESRVREIIMQEYKRLQQSEKSLLFFIHNVSDLTKTEREIIRLLLLDYKVKEIAEERCVELVTVKTQISGLLKKFGEKRTKAIVNKIKELNISHLF